MSIRNLTPAFVDYETFWDVGYSLRQQKVSLTDYIHDPRFEVHGAAVSLGQGEEYWLRGADLKAWLVNAQELGYMFVGHHTLFDGYVTTHTYNLEFPEYFCTMGMIEALFQGCVGRGLDEAMKSLLGWKEGKSDILARTKGKRWNEFTSPEKRNIEFYALSDVRAMKELFYKFSDQLPENEWRIMSTILKMFCHPRLVFDSELLQSALQNAHDERDERIQTAIDYFECTEKDLRGNNTFAALIERCGISMPMKPSPSVADKMIPALAKTDQGFNNLLEHDIPEVAALAEARMAVKSTQGITRAQRMVDLDKAIGKYPIAYNYARAHTLRLTGANKMNAANYKRGSDLRKAICAPPGYKLGMIDSSQIECRGVNYLAGNNYMLDLFGRKEDPYNDMASEIFRRPINRKLPEDELEGFLGKTAVLGLGFQMGGPKFKWTAETKAKTDLGKKINIDLNEAYRIVQVYRAKNWPVPKFWNFLQEAIGKMISDGEPFSFDYPDGTLDFVPKENKVYFPNGTFLFYPCLNYNNKTGEFYYISKLGKSYITKKIYGGLFCENIVQKFTRDIVVDQMLRIAEFREVVMHTYDENVALLPDETAEEDYKRMMDIMLTPPNWAKSFPLGAGGGISQEYSK